MNLNLNTIAKMLDTAFVEPTNRTRMMATLGVSSPRYYRLRKKWLNIKEESQNDADLQQKTNEFLNEIPAEMLLALINMLQIDFKDLFN